MSLKERLTAFYGIHNPEKLSAGLDQVVAAYEGKEEQLNAALRQQYGQDLTTTTTVKTDLRERLVSFYKVFNPAKISSADLDTVTQMFKDKEASLNQALRRQYGTDLAVLQKGLTTDQYTFLARLADFYKDHNTDRLMDGLDDLAIHFAGNPSKINGALLQQYNAGLTSGIGVTGTWLMKQKLASGCEFKFPIQLHQAADGKITGCGFLSISARCVFDGTVTGHALKMTQSVNGATSLTLEASLDRHKYIQGEWATPAAAAAAEGAGMFQAEKLDDESWIFEPAAILPTAAAAGAAVPIPVLDLHARLSAFYAVYNAEKLNDAPGMKKIVDAYQGANEDELNYALQNQYGTDLSESPGLSGIWSFKIIDAADEAEDEEAAAGKLATRCPGMAKVEYRYDIQLLHHKDGKVEGYGHLSPGITFALSGTVADSSTLTLTQDLGGGKLATLTAGLARSKFIKGTWANAAGAQGTWTADKQSGGRDSI